MPQHVLRIQAQVPRCHLQELWPSLDLPLGASLEVVAWAGSTSEWALAMGLSSLAPAGPSHYPLWLQDLAWFLRPALSPFTNQVEISLKK